MPEEPSPDPAERLGRALELAYRQLGTRDRTTAEVLAHLGRRGVNEATAATAVAELRRQGYLDDARYAQRFAEDRRRLDAWGDERIARRLEAAGVGAADIEAALGGQDLDETRAAAVALLRRRVRVAPATDRERERALGLLVRRGYELELAYDAVRAFEGGAA